MKTILFVCTGNVFRSMTAEYALRRELGGASSVRVSSAGTQDHPYTVRPEVREYLASRGLDVSAHRRRTLTAAMLAESDLAIAMDPTHQAIVQERFVVELPLFLALCDPGSASLALPDIEEAIPNYQADAAAAAHHIRATIDRIIDAIPRLAEPLRGIPRQRPKAG